MVPVSGTVWRQGQDGFRVDYAGARSDTTSGNGDGEVALAGAGPANQHDIALLGDEAAAGQVIDQRLVDRRALELEVVEVLGER